MTNILETVKTKSLLSLLKVNKEKELRLYKDKVLELEKLKAQNPQNTVYEFKYNLAKMRYNQLKRTTADLNKLEQEMRGLNLNLSINI